MTWLYNHSRRHPGASNAAHEFEGLMRQHVPALYRSAYRWTGSQERAEDLVQELLVRLFAMLDDLRQIEQVRPWAMRVMYRIFVDQVRRERSSPVEFGRYHMTGTDDETDEEEAIDATADPELLADREFAQERIIEAWTHLPTEHRVVLTMHDVEGYTLADISSLTDTAVGTIKSRLHRARTRLRQLLVHAAPVGTSQLDF